MASVSETILRLREIAEQIRKLDSLAPGNGYDPLGEELCRLVYQDFSKSEKEQILSLLRAKYSAVLSLLQRVSGESEILLQRSFIERITKESLSLSQGLNRNSRYKALRTLFSDYPYIWAEARAKEEAKLLKSGCGKESLTRVLYFGECGIPMIALEMHFYSGAKITWFDPREDTAKDGQRFVRHLEQEGVLSGGEIEIQHINEPFEKILEASSGRFSTIDGVVFLNAHSLTPGLVQLFSHCGIRTMICVEALGMAELLYPRLEIGVLKEKYQLIEVCLPAHCSTDELPNEYGDTVAYQSDSSDFFVSLARWELF